MKTEIIDALNNRTIVKDFDKDSISIVGDFSCSSITTYWVVNRFNPGCPLSISITLKRARRRCEHYNNEYHTDTFLVIRRTIFV